MNSVQKSALRVLALAALLVMITLAVRTPVQADGGDFSLDFVASAPNTYDRITGGGAFNDRTIGVSNDVVESLEGEDNQCGDLITYLIQIVVDDAPTHAVQTIEIDFSWLMDTTGQSGVALTDVVSVGINYGLVENGDDGTGVNPGIGNFGLDGGISDDGGSTATLVSEVQSGPPFVAGSELLATIEVDDLEASEEVILRMDILLACQTGSNPTGNLQGDLQGARVTVQNGVPCVGNTCTISGGNQTVPLKQIGNVVGTGEAALVLIKNVMLQGGTCGVDDVDSLILPPVDEGGGTVVYCYYVSNPGTANLYDVTVTDDNATPGNLGDDFSVTVAPLANLDNQADTGDLGSNLEATGQSAPIAYTAEGVFINTACADGIDSVSSAELIDCDTATVTVPAPTAITLLEVAPTSATPVMLLGLLAAGFLLLGVTAYTWRRTRA